MRDAACSYLQQYQILNIPCIAANSGSKLNSAQIAANAVQSGGTYCLNLISLVGSLCSEKYFPLFACTSAPLRVEIQLVSSPLQALCSQVAVASFAISNCEYVANMIELSDSAMQVITSSTNGDALQFVFTDYRNFVHSSALADAATATINAPIAAKYASLKSLFVAIRDTAKSTAITFFPFSSHHFNLVDYTFRIGPNVLPSKAPNTYPEMFSELVKAIGSMSDINHQPSIDYYSYCGNINKGPIADCSCYSLHQQPISGVQLLIMILRQVLVVMLIVVHFILALILKIIQAQIDQPFSQAIIQILMIFIYRQILEV